MSSEDRTPEERRLEAISGLRAFADWLEEHEDAIAYTDPALGLRLLEFPRERDRLEERMRTLGGPWDVEKRPGGTVIFWRYFGPSIRYGLHIQGSKIGTPRVVEETVTDVAPALVALAAESERSHPDAVPDCPTCHGRGYKLCGATPTHSAEKAWCHCTPIGAAHAERPLAAEEERSSSDAQHVVDSFDQVAHACGIAPQERAA